MRPHLIVFVTTIFLVATTANAFAISLSALADRSNSPVQLIQDQQDKKGKSETLRQKVKRIWKELIGYRFDVGCPIFPIQLTHSTCTETGKNVEDARAKCQAQNPFCAVSQARPS